jgi:hypothetical protein
MIEFLVTAGPWLGLLAFVYGACLVIACAAEEIRAMPRSCGPLAMHDWDAPDRALERRRRAEWSYSGPTKPM